MVPYALPTGSELCEKHAPRTSRRRGPVGLRAWKAPPGARLDESSSYDSSVPAWVRERLQARVAEMFHHFVPPLSARDVAGVALEVATVLLLVRTRPRGQQWDPDNEWRVRPSAFELVRQTCPGLLERAGFLPGFWVPDPGEFATAQWRAWLDEIEELRRLHPIRRVFAYGVEFKNPIRNRRAAILIEQDALCWRAAASGTLLDDVIRALKKAGRLMGDTDAKAEALGTIYELRDCLHSLLCVDREGRLRLNKNRFRRVIASRDGVGPTEDLSGWSVDQDPSADPETVLCAREQRDIIREVAAERRDQRIRHDARWHVLDAISRGELDLRGRVAKGRGIRALRKARCVELEAIAKDPRIRGLAAS